MNTPNPLTLEATIAQDNVDRIDKTERCLDFVTWVGRVLLLCVLFLSPWMFGSVDPWTQRYIAIAIGIGLGIWWFETALRRTRSQVIPYVFFPVAIGILIAMFQLWELPASLASILLGRQTELYEQLGEGLKLSPTISMSHEGTRHFIGLLSLGISALLLGCRYFRTRFEVTLLLTVMTVNGTLLTFFGLIQAMTCPSNLMYWSIELVNGGAKFGPYVNRNNAAGYLLICLACSIGLMTLLVGKKVDRGPRLIVGKEMPFWRQLMFHVMLFISELDAKKIASIIATIVIGVGVISTVSRGGVVALLVGLFVTLLMYGMARRPSFSGFIFLPMLLLVVLLASWVGLADQLLERLENTDLEGANSNRLVHWQQTWPAVSDMGVFGSGIGSYDSVHRLYRMTPEKRIYQYGESQFFQTLVELGWPGLGLLLLSWGMVAYYSLFSLWRGNSPVTVGVGVAGVFLFSSGMMAAAFDFGLYHSSANTIAMAVVSGILAYNAHALSQRLKGYSWLQHQIPNSFNQLVGLALFAGVFVAGLGLHTRAAIDATREISRFTVNQPDLASTERMIEQMRPLVKRMPIRRGLNYLARLYVHRMRLQYFKVMQKELGIGSEQMPEEERATVEANLWELTSLEYVQANIYSLKRESSVLAAQAFQQQAFIQDNLPYAVNALHVSRRGSILQAEQHRLLMQMYAVLGKNRLAAEHAQLASQLAPSNLKICEQAATYFLQSENGEEAAPYIRRLLELTPKSFNEIADLLEGKSVKKIKPVEPAVVLEKFLPDDPQLIYQYVTQRVPETSEVRKAGLAKAEQILGDVSPANHNLMVLSGKIKLGMGRTEEALEQFKTSLVSKPTDYWTNAKIIELQNQLEMYHDSISRLEDLIRRDYLHKKAYVKLLEKTKSLATEKKNSEDN